LDLLIKRGPKNSRSDQYECDEELASDDYGSSRFFVLFVVPSVQRFLRIVALVADVLSADVLVADALVADVLVAIDVAVAVERVEANLPPPRM
jgi:hypothetical protein